MRRDSWAFALPVLGAIACGCGHGGVAGDASIDTAIDANDVCGDAICGVSESCSGCPEDCGACSPTCGDRICEATTEDCADCSADCGTCSATCGDGACDAAETCTSCAGDCGTCSTTCGDGTCDASEACASCAADCGTCGATCDDGTCDVSETCASCPSDCGVCSGGCGNGTCDPAEDCGTCGADCGSCPGSCGDAMCSPIESCTTCAADCGACLPTCGDASCDVGEDCNTCPADCGACVGCGDAACDPSEACNTCPTDCGMCPGVCGDASCSPTETCSICASDCSSCETRCGDGVCDASETCDACASDCGACSSSCGDGTCDASESCTACARDCGTCGAFCGDASCDAGETCMACTADCGPCGATCGDGACDAGETCRDCPADCHDLCPHPSMTCSRYTGLVRPASCPHAAEVVIWTQNGWRALVDAIAVDHTDCAEYWVSLPAVHQPTSAPGQMPALRYAEADRIHAHGVASLHALAEVHWGDWARWRRAHHTTWTEVGRTFRQTVMVAPHFCVESGDTWEINEVPSGARRGDSVCLEGAHERTCHRDSDCPSGRCQSLRDSLVELVTALHGGTGGVPASRGAALIVDYGEMQASGSTSVYRANMEAWLADGAFWAGVSPHVRFWGQEVYTDPWVTCGHDSPALTLAQRMTRIEDYTESTGRLVHGAGAPSSTGAAASYLGRAYLPLMNAFWGSNGAYGHTDISIENMQMLISEQVRATRLWADGHTYPDGRLGFGFGAASMSSADWTTLAVRVAAAIRGAYGPSTSAGGACDEGGTARWCGCTISAPVRPDLWSSYDTW